MRNLSYMDEISGKELVMVISCIFEHMTAKYDMSGGFMPTSIFSCQEIPRIPLREYLEKIRQRTLCSTQCLVLSLIYVDRLLQCTHLVVNSLNVHKLLLTGSMVAAKFSDDSFCSNAFYAEIGCVSLEDINVMEAEFLFGISFSLYVDEELFIKYFSGLRQHLLSSSCSNCYNMLYPQQLCLNRGYCNQPPMWMYSPVSPYTAWSQEPMSPFQGFEDVTLPPMTPLALPVPVLRDGSRGVYTTARRAQPPDCFWGAGLNWY